MIRILSTVAELRAWRRDAVTPVVLVPTMGALHAGHTTLVEEARKLAGSEGGVIASVFVNPLQFGPNEDFQAYPRELESDAAKCEAAGADVVFAPPVAEVYSQDRSIQVFETSLSKRLCGASRPGHFDGVCTVVAKLFNLVQPTDAVFGKKDYQQLAIIRRLVRDLNFPVRVHGVDTVREADGLAMSSRNRYLTKEERAQAPAIRAALLKMRTARQSGETSAEKLIALGTEHLQANAPSGRIDYLEVVDRHTMQPLDPVNEDGLIAAAMFFGKARLIDNIEVAGGG